MSTEIVPSGIYLENIERLINAAIAPKVAPGGVLWDYIVPVTPKVENGNGNTRAVVGFENVEGVTTIYYNRIPIQNAWPGRKTPLYTVLINRTNQYPKNALSNFLGNMLGLAGTNFYTDSYTGTELLKTEFGYTPRTITIRRDRNQEYSNFHPHLVYGFNTYPQYPKIVRSGDVHQNIITDVGTQRAFEVQEQRTTQLKTKYYDTALIIDGASITAPSINLAQAGNTGAFTNGEFEISTNFINLVDDGTFRALASRWEELNKEYRIDVNNTTVRFYHAEYSTEDPLLTVTVDTFDKWIHLVIQRKIVGTESQYRILANTVELGTQTVTTQLPYTTADTLRIGTSGVTGSEVFHGALEWFVVFDQVDSTDPESPYPFMNYLGAGNNWAYTDQNAYLMAKIVPDDIYGIYYSRNIEPAELALLVVPHQLPVGELDESITVDASGNNVELKYRHADAFDVTPYFEREKAILFTIVRSNIEASLGAGLNIGQSDFTIETLYNITTVEGISTVFQIDDGTGLNVEAALTIEDGYPIFTWSRDGTIATITSPYKVEVDKWQHIAVTRSGNTFFLHQNGQHVGTTSSSVQFESINQKLWIGNSKNPATGEFATDPINDTRLVNLKGTMSEFAVWLNTARYTNTQYGSIAPIWLR